MPRQDSCREATGAANQYIAFSPIIITAKAMFAADAATSALVRNSFDAIATVSARQTVSTKIWASPAKIRSLQPMYRRTWLVRLQ